MTQTSILDGLRSDYHRNILEKILGRRRKRGEKRGNSYYSNADSGNVGSIALSECVALKLKANTGQEPCQSPPKEQTAGNVFASLTKDFLDKAFTHLQHLRPGTGRFPRAKKRGE